MIDFCYAIRLFPCELYALKAQKYKAWGNAPGITTHIAKRAVGAKVTKRPIYRNNTYDYFCAYSATIV